VKSLINSFISKVVLASRQQASSTLPMQPVRPFQGTAKPVLWNIDEPGYDGNFAESAAAKSIELLDQNNQVRKLQELAGTTTLLLLVSHDMAILPGIGHRISRRSETLGQGVRLVPVVEQPQPGLPSAFLDSDGQVRNLAGGRLAPILVSLDARGHVFDVSAEVDAIMDWLWNEPRPHSMRASGAMTLDDVMA
jgi:hypothetical protein